MHFHNFGYCAANHPTLHGISCDLEVGHESKHIHYDVTMDGTDIEWDEGTSTMTTPKEWYIERHGLYRCCIKFLKDYLTKTPSPAERTRCPKCNGQLKQEGGTWRWNV